MSGGAASGRKGAFAEREVAAILSDLTGYPVERRLREGRIDDIGDLDGLPGCVAQVKWYVNVQRAVREGMPALIRQQAIADYPYGVLFVRRSGRIDHDRWVAVMPIESFATLYVDACAGATEIIAASGE